MNLKEAIYSRRAVRDYTAEPVSEQIIGELIDAAIQAPSARNEQPWSFTVVRDSVLLDRISTEARYHMLRTTPSELLWHEIEEGPEATDSFSVRRRAGNTSVNKMKTCYIAISGSDARCFASSGTSVIVASVSSRVLATETAFSSATRTTLVGSMMPASIKSTYCLRPASKP